MIIYVVHPEKATKKLLRLISELAKLPDTWLICKNELCFYILGMNNLKLNFNNTMHNSNKNMKYLGINLIKHI